MQKEPKKHHYISQCYLKGFSKLYVGMREPRLTVFDFKNKKTYLAKSEDLCYENYFNRIDSAHTEPNELERRIGDVEADFAEAVRNVTDSLEFSGESKGIILLMMALFLLRNPQMREHKNEFINEIGQVMLSMMASCEVGTKFSGIEVTPEIKRTLEKKDCFKVAPDRNWHIHMETQQLDNILSHLFNRKWVLGKAPENVCFITCDNPVILTWTIEGHPPYPPGHALPNTRLIFPLTSELALIGEFDGEEKSVMVNDEFVALINDVVFIHTRKQIYSREDSFLRHDAETKEIINFSRDFFDSLSAKSDGKS